MSEIDPDLSARWRAASDEQPPTALDDAIRAAARREVGAKPGGFRAMPRWWPLAAAATVAVLAVGIVQMTPPEQVAPASFPPTTDTVRRDVKTDADKPIENSSKPDAVAAAPPRLQSDMLREEVKSVAKEQRSRASDEKASRAGARVGGFAAAPDAQFQEKKAIPSPAQRIEDAPERDQALKQKSELAAASSVARQDSNVASAPAASAPHNEVQPFPATPVPAEAGAENVPKPMAAAAPAPAPPSVSTSASSLAARKLVAQSATAASSDNGASNRGGSIASNDAGNAEPPPAKESAALGKVTAAEAAKAAPERRKDAAPLAPDEWIKRIRRLIAEGRNEDAARELTAFRREYKERSDALLPSDLRAFKQ